MANEIRTTYPGEVNLYAMVRNSSDEIWFPTNEVWETYGTSDRTAADYAITLTDQSGGLYTADFPDNIAVGTYTTMIYLRNGASPADVPTDDVIGIASIKWTGSTVAAEAADETTATEVCNMAFIKLGEPVIGAIYDGTPQAALCLVLYPRIRNEVLFKLKRTSFADLGAALSGASLVAAAEWDYQFNLPADCITVVRQTDEEDQITSYPYDIKRGVLLTNDYSNEDGDSAYIEYVYLNENAATYHPMETDAIATLLAAELAPTIKGKENYREGLLQEFELIALPQAIAEAQSEVYDPEEGEDVSWLDARLS